ncbi:GntR family transcriptional regulator [Murinocardiopsis flavida]|uniref:GntR family transcriptional regulator n=1 Tax=Murinocardiopsis flavida TaxID=645275 RepID=A0A2P8DPE4_9ACTN|nr:GntR family transcriptional regulator [Murinocardiopsis flavida]PSK99097.1 GntR family transcriptional regulator [Murinocardiopsis flavida]
MTSKSDPRPRHQQIAAEIRTLIMAGEMEPGQKLPTTQQLMTQYKVTSQTVQRTLAVLKGEGFIVGRVGIGVFVRSKSPLVIQPASYMPPAEGSDPYRWVTEAETRSQRGKIRSLRVEEVVPPRGVADAFGIPVGGTALLRHQVLVLDDRPAELASVYFPLELAHGTALLEPKKIRGGAPKILADIGHTPVKWVDRLSVRLPTSEELLALELPDDVPVMRTFRTVYSDFDRPVQVEILIKGGHMYELSYEQQVD